MREVRQSQSQVRIVSRAMARPALLGSLDLAGLVPVRPSAPQRLRLTSGDADLVAPPERGVSEARLDVSVVEHPVRVQEVLETDNAKTQKVWCLTMTTTSEVSGDEEFLPPTEPDPMVVESRSVTPAIRATLAELDTVDVVVTFFSELL